MAPAKLTKDQRNKIIQWMAAGHTYGAIHYKMKRAKMPKVTDRTLNHYKKRYTPRINEIMEARKESAMVKGLATREERISQLIEHAQELEEIKWKKDDNGRIWNEKAWRETLEQIRREMGHDRPDIDSEVILLRLPTYPRPEQQTGEDSEMSEAGE